jgi:large subunit ribosomal protein L22
MGARKRKMAERQKEIKKQTAIAKLKNVPTSPQKMRLLADTIRGVEVNRALDLLKYSNRAAAPGLAKLLKSAISVWESKNEADRKELDNGNVFVRTVMVDEGKTLKRIRTAPQGRAARIRKRSNHVTIILGMKADGKEVEKAVDATVAGEVAEAAKPVSTGKATAKKAAPKKKTATAGKTTKKVKKETK